MWFYLYPPSFFEIAIFQPQHTLGMIGCLIGKALFMYRFTAAQIRVTCARICIEIQAGDELPNKLKMVDEYRKGLWKKYMNECSSSA